MPSVYIVSTTWIIKFDPVKLMHTRKHYALVFTINLQLALAQEPVIYIITLYRLILLEVTCIWRTWASLRPHGLQTSRLWGEPWLTRRPRRQINPFSTPEARVGGFWAIQTWYKPNNHARRAHHHYESGTQQIHCQFTIRWACTLTMILVVHKRLASLEMVSCSAAIFRPSLAGPEGFRAVQEIRRAPRDYFRPWNCTIANQCGISTETDQAWYILLPDTSMYQARREFQHCISNHFLMR